MISKKKIWHNGNSVRRGSWNASRFGCTGACRGDSENGAGNAERSGGCTGHAK